MSASDSAPVTTSLHQSIEQLIAESLKQSQSLHEAEKQRLTAALSAALGDIEAGQQAFARAAETIRAALNGEEEAAPETTVEEPVTEPVNDEPMPPAEEPVPVEVSANPASDRGPHELDVIAHGASIDNAIQLQTLLRERPQVTSAQTREFVNGELRLHLSLESGMDLAALGDWLAAHSGQLVTSSDSVIEIRFAS
jgi:uncharacterized phage infection (PIP) family protein YhgE